MRPPRWLTYDRTEVGDGSFTVHYRVRWWHPGAWLALARVLWWRR